MISHVIAYRSAELLFGMHAFNFNCFFYDFNCVFKQIRCICTAQLPRKATSQSTLEAFQIQLAALTLLPATDVFNLLTLTDLFYLYITCFKPWSMSKLCTLQEYSVLRDAITEDDEGHSRQ